MSLETVSGAMFLLLGIVIPLTIFAIALIAYSVRYWLEKRKEKHTHEVLATGIMMSESIKDAQEGRVSKPVSFKTFEEQIKEDYPEDFEEVKE